MKNGWTGGQYSLIRFVAGCGCLYAFGASLAAVLLTDHTPRFVNILERAPLPALLLGTGALMSVALAIGWFDRVAAVVLALLLFSLRYPPMALVAICIVHVTVPPRPYGSWAARGREDPGSGWRWPTVRFEVARSLVLIVYCVLLIAPLFENNRFAPPEFPWLVGIAAVAAFYLALSPRGRRWAWCVLLALTLWNLMRTGATGMLILMLFFCDPAWLRPRLVAKKERVFFDGGCGLCHRSVRFLLAEDRFDSFRFAPLDSVAFREALPEERREAVPDSVVVLTVEGRLLVRSAGVLHALVRLGGIWRVIALAVRLVPRVLLDRVYDLVAATRYRIWGKTTQACPIVPPKLQNRFIP